MSDKTSTNDRGLLIVEEYCWQCVCLNIERGKKETKSMEVEQVPSYVVKWTHLTMEKLSEVELRVDAFGHTYTYALFFFFTMAMVLEY